MFYVTYITFSIPGTLLAKKYRPDYIIAFGAFAWSCGAACMAASSSYAGIVVCRLLIGFGEAMFGQVTSFYYSLWYTKHELSKRLAAFIGMGVLAGAFSGLIAYGVAHINTTMDHWRILFLIEGLPSVLLAIAVFFFLPSRPKTSRYLNEEERTLAHTRMNAQSNERESGIDWRAVRYAFKQPTTYIVALMYSCTNLNLGSVNGFLPTIIKTLGYSNANAQLFSVPPYAVTLVVMYGLNYMSDRQQRRGYYLILAFAIGLVGWAILLGVAHNLHARYFATFCIVTSGYTVIPITMAWQSANSPSESQRAVRLGMLNTIGQALGILASFSFPKNEGPRYIKGVSINMAFSILGMFIATGMVLYYKRENSRRDAREGGRPAAGTKIDCTEHFDSSVGFRYTL